MEQATDDQAEGKGPSINERLGAIVGAHEKEAEDRVQDRNLIEKRWIGDLSQYYGKYSDEEVKQLQDEGKSQIFVNQTRTKTNTMISRLQDMLFPTDDKNFGIGPTPVPELTHEAEQAAAKAHDAVIASLQNPENPELAQMAQEMQTDSERLAANLEEASERASLMEDEIADNLKECDYSAQARNAIEDAAILGTGVLKGPVIGEKARRHWSEAQDEQGSVVHVMIESAAESPEVWRVDVWDFFPDMKAKTVEESEGIYERHLMNAKQIRALARKPGFDQAQEAFRRILREGPQETLPTYVADMRSITGAYNGDSTENQFLVWEYHGPLSADDLRIIAEATEDEALLGDAGVGEEIDPLMEINVSLWFCQGELLKIGIHPLDSGDCIYSTFCIERDPVSIFGFGIPHIMRDSQKSLNSAWRAILDNAGLSAGPQIEIDQDVIEPANGSWALEPRKIWLRKKGSDSNQQGVRAIDIPSRQGDLAQIVAQSERFIDSETGIPLIAQGEQGSHITQTAHGMSILMNSANITFKRVVKNWDDDITVPIIRRLYDWHMQFSEKEHIKGDYEVDARGSSVLLVREMQITNLMMLIDRYVGHPVVGRFIREDGLIALRNLVKTMMLPVHEVVKSDSEIAADDALAAQSPPPPPPEIMRIEAELNKVEMERQFKTEQNELERKHKMDMALLERESRLMALAEQHNMKLEDLRGRLEINRQQIANRERQFAAEAAVSQRIGPSGGGHF